LYSKKCIIYISGTGRINRHYSKDNIKLVRNKNMNLKDFIINALSSKKPSLYFKNNEDVGKEIFPELYKLKAVPESEDYHYHDNTFDHVMMVVDEVAKKTNQLNIR